MTITQYISPEFVTEWHDDIKPSLFQMSKDLGNVQTITFHRDADDGSDVAVGPYEALVVIASGGAPQVGADGSTAFVGVSGELRSDDPAFTNVPRDARFCLNTGACGSVKSDPIDRGAFLSVPYVLER